MLIPLLTDPQGGDVFGRGSYRFDGERIGLYINGKLIYAESAQIGDVYDAKEIGWKIYLNKVGIPEKRGGVIAWLLKFNKKNRTSSEERLKQILEKECCQCPWNGGTCQPKCLRTTSYVIYICGEEHNRTGYKSVAAWISDAITKQEVLSLVPFMTYYPEKLVKYLLDKHFGITDAEFARAKKSHPKYF